MKNKNISEDQLESFRKNGFVVIDDLFSHEMFDEVAEAFCELINIKVASLEPDVSIEQIHPNQPLEAKADAIRRKLFELEKLDHQHVRELHDAIRDDASVVNMVSNGKVKQIARTLMGLTDAGALYCKPYSIRIDVPGDTAFKLDWHQEVHYSFKGADLVQIWAPVLHDIKDKDGPLHVLPGSHLGGVAETKDEIPEFGHAQYRVIQKVIERYQEQRLALKLGSVVFFSNRLIHKSGENTSDLSRLTLISMFTNVNSPNFFNSILPPKKINNPYAK